MEKSNNILESERDFLPADWEEIENSVSGNIDDYSKKYIFTYFNLPVCPCGHKITLGELDFTTNYLVDDPDVCSNCGSEYTIKEPLSEPEEETAHVIDEENKIIYLNVKVTICDVKFNEEDVKKLMRDGRYKYNSNDPSQLSLL